MITNCLLVSRLLILTYYFRYVKLSFRYIRCTILGKFFTEFQWLWHHFVIVYAQQMDSLCCRIWKKIAEFSVKVDKYIFTTHTVILYDFECICSILCSCILPDTGLVPVNCHSLCCWVFCITVLAAYCAFLLTGNADYSRDNACNWLFRTYFAMAPVKLYLSEKLHTCR